MRKYLSSGLVILALFSSAVLSGQSTNNLFFVFLNSNPDKPEITKQDAEKIQSAHLNNIEQLTSEGIMKAAGPFDGGGGMFILKTEDINSANEILQTDPAIKAERFIIEVFPLMIANNDLCGAKEPYEMVTYQFVRTISNVEFFGDIDKMRFENRVFMAELNNSNDYVIVQGSFNEYNDGLLILDVADAEEAEKIIKKHPAVQEGQLNYEVKSLWIAKGTFCKR